MSLLSFKSSLNSSLVNATLVILILVELVGCKRSLELGNVYDTWEASNDQFKVRVKAFEEHSQFEGGGYLVYEAAPRGTDRWQQVMAFRHDDPIPIPHDSIHFVSDRVGFVFLGWKYAATNDAGQTWSVWNAETDIPNWSCCNYGLIRNADLSVEGRGKMTLHPIAGRNEPTELMTEDYGRHWHR